MSDKPEEKTCRTCGHTWTGSDLIPQSCPICQGERRRKERRDRRDQKIEFQHIKLGSRPHTMRSLDEFTEKKKDEDPKHLGPFWHRKTGTFRPEWKRDET